MADQNQEKSYIILANEVANKEEVIEASEETQPAVELTETNDQTNTTGINKIFVGGLPTVINEVEFKEFFEKFGTITDSVIIYDKYTRASRGFGFITFHSEEAINNVLKQKFYVLKNKHVEVKKAKSKKDSNTRGPIINRYGRDYFQPFYSLPLPISEYYSPYPYGYENPIPIPNLHDGFGVCYYNYTSYNSYAYGNDILGAHGHYPSMFNNGNFVRPLYKSYVNPLNTYGYYDQYTSPVPRLQNFGSSSRNGA